MTEQEQIEKMSDVRRDTAKEFARRICEMLWNLGIDKDGNRFSYGDLTSKNVLYIAKQFGVDIDERLCEENKIATSHINKLVEQEQEIAQLKADNARLTAKLGQVLLSIDTVKEMNTMCSIDEKIKQAKIEVLNELKTKAFDIDDCNGWAGLTFVVLVRDIDKMIEEVEE